MAKQERDLGREKKKEIAREAGDRDYTPLYNKLKGNGKLTIDHKRTAHLFVKMIVSSGAHPLIQKIMSLRLLGHEPHYIPMSVTGVALALGLRRHDVKRFEKEGINHVRDYFERVSIEEARDKYNRQNSGKKSDLLNHLANPLDEAASKEDEDG